MTNTDVDTCASRTVHVQIGNGQILPSQKQQHKHALVRANRKTHMYSTWSTVQTHQWFLCNYVEEPGGPRFHSRHKICYVHDFRITHITAERSKQVLLKTLLSIHTDISPLPALLKICTYNIAAFAQDCSILLGWFEVLEK